MTLRPADSNALDLPGDILLLCGRGKTSLANRGSQALLRLGPARFTHVAVVLGNGLIADAMPEQGVTIRRWRDMESGYDIAACRVARNAALASNPRAAALVLERVRYYIRQPYVLTALVKRRVQDKSGLVCSQFAAAVLKDAGFAPSGRRVTVTLPLDIDRHTRKTPGWRQFPLAESALFSGYRPAPDGGAADAIPLPALNAAQQDDFHDLLVKSINDQHDVSRLIKTLDEASDAFLQQLEQDGPDAATEGELQDQAGLEPGVEGAALLDAWRAAFPDSTLGAPLFLHDEDQAERLARRRSGLTRAVAGLHRGASQLREQFEAFDKTIQALPGLMGSRRCTPDFLDQVIGLLDMLIAQGDALFGHEAVGGIERRIGDYPQLIMSGVLPWVRAQADQALADEAVAAFTQLCEIDQERLLWATVRQPHLAAVRANLAPLLEALTSA